MANRLTLFSASGPKPVDKMTMMIMVVIIIIKLLIVPSAASDDDAIISFLTVFKKSKTLKELASRLTFMPI